MSTIFYGSVPGGGTSSRYDVGVLLTRVQMLSYEREPMWNGPDYLGTVHRLRVRGIYNPQVNAYDFFGGAPFASVPQPNMQAAATASATGVMRDHGVIANINNAPAEFQSVQTTNSPGEAPGAAGVTTDVAVKHWMMQPRRQLVYMVGEIPALVSPSLNSDGTAAQCDMYNGPLPLSCDVVQISGTKTFLVDFAVETYLNEAYFYVDKPSVLLSHRWSQRQDIDQDYYSTIVTTGIAHFRTDRLLFLGAVPDDFRSYLFFPKVQGMKRTCNVEASEDGSMLRYTIVDRELALSIIPNGVTRVECFHSAGGRGMDLEKTISSLGGVPTKFGQIFQPGGRFGKGEGTKLISSVFLHSLYSAIRSMGSIDFLPRLHVSCTARVWGRQTTLRKTLENVAVNLVLTRLAMSVSQFALFTSGAELNVTHDVAGTFVECVGSLTTMFNQTSQAILNLVQAPLDTQILIGNFAQFFRTGNMPQVQNCFPDFDATPFLLDLGPDGDGMDLPSGAVTLNNRVPVTSRGTYLQRIAAAALLSPNQIPAAPPAEVAWGTRTPP